MQWRLSPLEDSGRISVAALWSGAARPNGAQRKPVWDSTYAHHGANATCLQGEPYKAGY